MVSPLFTPTRRPIDRLTGFERKNVNPQQIQPYLYMAPPPVQAKKKKRSAIFDDDRNPVMYSPVTRVVRPVVRVDQRPYGSRPYVRQQPFLDTITPEQYVIGAAILGFWVFLGYQYARVSKTPYNDTWKWVWTDETTLGTSTSIPGSSTTSPIVDHPFTDFTDEKLEEVVEEITFDAPPPDKAVVGGKTLDLEDVLSHTHFWTANKVTLRDAIKKRDDTNLICSGLTIQETGRF